MRWERDELPRSRRPLRRRDALTTLRTLGASRRQVLWSVVIEAFVIGVFGSVVGLFLGLGIAKLLNALFVAIGIDLPHGSTVFSTRTIVVSLLTQAISLVMSWLVPSSKAPVATSLKTSD